MFNLWIAQTVSDSLWTVQKVSILSGQYLDLTCKYLDCLEGF